MYTDSASEEICDSAAIPAASCANGSCVDYFEASSSLCSSSTNIDVSIVASNILGNGATSSPLVQGVNIEKKLILLLLQLF